MKKVHLMMLVWLIGSACAATGCDEKTNEEAQKQAECVGDACEPSCTPENCPDGTCEDGKCVEACTGSECGKVDTCSAETCPDG
ncbi:MAG: hypothetical protein IJ268_04205, partial [Proteobacteria bacterium]|nr:hypothetical protein [Pseudomonadota bacterium]